MRHRHELHYCDLCVENLKIFSHERRCYTRADLAQHRRKGDVDDKSHKGHPLCEFCDQRYMDNDELFRHLRRDHLYCHFCDADGLHQYYSSYDYLRDHFRQEHFLCEEGVCAEEKFTSVFRTDIDLKAHKASVHSKQLSKAAAKQARTLELEFTLAPRGENRMNRRGMVGASTSRSSRDYGGRDFNVREYQQTVTSNTSNVYVSNNEQPTFVRQPSVDVQSTEEFPTLGNTAPIVPTLSQNKGRGNVTIRSTIRPQPLAVTDENFPALGPESGNTSISKTVNFSVSSSNASGSNAQSQKSTTSNVSIQVNHEPNGTVTTKVSGPNIRIRPAQLSMESFPALGSAEPSTSNNTNSAHWKEVLQWTCTKSATAPAPKPKKVASPPLVPSPPPIQSGEDFPTLSKSSKSKKQSTITVVPSWGQSQSQSSNNSNNAKTTTDMTKGKTKKKKVKQNNSHNNAGSESSSSKANLSTVVVKKESETPKSPSSRNNVNAVQSSSNTARQTDNIGNIEDTSKNMNVQSPKETEQQSNKKEKKKHKNVDNEATVNTYHIDNASNGVQRKRTELKIDSLNSNRNVRQLEEFPALSGSSSKPPGFTNPPPGFGTTTPPPPGFCIKYDNMDKLNNSNGLTFTNSSGESYSILPNNSKHSDAYNYVPPSEFQKRNKSLVAKVNEVLIQQDQIDEFRYISGLFRQGTCNAQEYYMHCRVVMGASAFENVFPELLVLLPDIEKQQELFKVHKKESGNKIKGLEICATCGQVLKHGSDFRAHMTSHTLENHFPALGKISAPSQKNSWVRK
ncbi:E3 ubiquitin-protein ligase ZNF598 isoform X2 [Ceratina calcarata]|nr:E3 ubiquitin-protein ligase ZNF598 isoform X2 [Ceratina calcarata]